MGTFVGQDSTVGVKYVVIFIFKVQWAVLATLESSWDPLKVS